VGGVNWFLEVISVQLTADYCQQMTFASSSREQRRISASSSSHASDSTTGDARVTEFDILPSRTEQFSFITK